MHAAISHTYPLGTSNSFAHAMSTDRGGSGHSFILSTTAAVIDDCISTRTCGGDDDWNPRLGLTNNLSIHFELPNLGGLGGLGGLGPESLLLEGAPVLVLFDVVPLDARNLFEHVLKDLKFTGRVRHLPSLVKCCVDMGNQEPGQLRGCRGGQQGSIYGGCAHLPSSFCPLQA